MTVAILLLPEALVLAGAVVAVVLGRSGRRDGSLLLAVAVLAALVVELAVGGQVATVLPGVYRQDRFALFAKAALLISTFIALLAGWRNERAPSTAPQLPLLLACLAGLLAASSAGPATLLLWTELALVAVLGLSWGASRESRRPVLIFAAATFACAAAGLALLYGLTGWTTFEAMRGSAGPRLTVLLGIAALVVVAALIAQLLAIRWFGPIAAGVAGIALLKFMGATSGLAGAGAILLPAAAALLMLVAAFGALAGGRPVSLLGWAGLLQLGWVVAGLTVPGRPAFAASLFLLGAFIVASSAGALADLGPHGLAGLPERGLGRALGLSACLLSLAGLPPLAGFFGVFAVSAQLAGNGRFWLVAIGLLAAAAVTFSVLRDLRLVFLSSPGETVTRSVGERSRQAGGVMAALLLVAYGLFANPISGLALQGAFAAGAR